MKKQQDIQRIAIIGTGIAGLSAAYLLNKDYDITVFEQNNYIGGHTHTIKVNTDSGDYDIDTGFIVFNQKTYPNFCRLLKILGVASQKSNMSFSFSEIEQGLEYSGDSFNGLFAQRKNIINPRFYQLLYDIYQFNKLAKKFLYHNNSNSVTVKEFIKTHSFSKAFINHYLTPLTAAIWSTPLKDVGGLPAKFILQFYENHGLLNMIDRPQWYVIKGGSKSYVDKLIKEFKNKIYLNAAVKNVIRDDNIVTIETEESTERFDAVVMACHSDQALRLLAEPSVDEQAILSNIPYINNHVVLHTDNSVLPRNKKAWASWNYQYINNNKASLTYYMNKLQGIDAPEDFCVSMNTPNIDNDKIISSFNYAHPLFSQDSIAAKEQFEKINNQQRTFYAGAYWGYGFHEDGLVSSLNALAPLGIVL